MSFFYFDESGTKAHSYVFARRGDAWVQGRSWRDCGLRPNLACAAWPNAARGSERGAEGTLPKAPVDELAPAPPHRLSRRYKAPQAGSNQRS